MSDFRKRPKPQGPPPDASEAEVKRYWKDRYRHEKRKERIMCKRAYVFETIIGQNTELICHGCGLELPCYAYAEVHHMDGRDWPMDLSQEVRADIMVMEVECGVWLEVMCKSCNSSIGNPREQREAA